MIMFASTGATPTQALSSTRQPIFVHLIKYFVTTAKDFTEKQILK